MRFPVRFVSQTPNINFMRWRNLAFASTIILVLASIALLCTKGLNFGIDFAGGTVFEFRTEKPLDLGTLRSALEAQETLGEINLQYFGTEQDILLRAQQHKNSHLDQAALINSIKQVIESTAGGTIDYRKIDYVGPQVGDELVASGILAVALAMMSIMIYVWIRFDWRYGIGAIAALFHDAIVTMGFFSLTGLEFNLTSVAAVLTIVGYSINDSVVIYDRIRDNLRKYKKMPLAELINNSLNETLSRTLLTVATTLTATMALVIWGGPVLESFSLAILFGIAIGTYSSIYISAPLLIHTNLRKSEG